MKKRKNPFQSPTGHTSSAAAEILAIMKVLIDRLSMPDLQTFAAAHARGMDCAPQQIPKTALLAVPLVTAYGPRPRATLGPSKKIPTQIGRLNAILNGTWNTDPECAKLVRQACATLGRFPLGHILATADTLASPIPVRFIHHALLMHQLRRDGTRRLAPDILAADGSRPWFVTGKQSQAGAWPAFLICTAPYFTKTLIILRGEQVGLPGDAGAG
jgi:hypothetical protein